MAFECEKQSVTAEQLLAALADGRDIHLSQCTITGSVDVNKLLAPDNNFQTETLSLRQEKSVTVLTFPQSIVFDKCLFEENVVFTAPWSQPQALSVEFVSDVIFNSSVFNSQGRFRNAVFKGIAGFDGCTFNGVATFKNAVFCGDAKFRTVTFGGYVLCGEAVFKSSARFTNSHFAKGVNFSEVRFEAATDFNGVYSSSRTMPNYDSIFFAAHRYGDDVSFWRFAKQSAQEAGYYQLAGECFYKERCGNLRHKVWGTYNGGNLSAAKKIIRHILAIRLLPELIFGRLLFGYGERPWRVLVASALVILGCAFFYSIPDMLIYRAGPTDATFLQGLYFSTITFTTLGYGDLYPTVDSLCRLVAMTEAAAGGCLMALFVVSLAKRFSRG